MPYFAEITLAEGSKSNVSFLMFNLCSVLHCDDIGLYSYTRVVTITSLTEFFCLFQVA